MNDQNEYICLDSQLANVTVLSICTSKELHSTDQVQELMCKKTRLNLEWI